MHENNLYSKVYILSLLLQGVWRCLEFQLGTFLLSICCDLYWVDIDLLRCLNLLCACHFSVPVIVLLLWYSLVPFTTFLSIWLSVALP